MYYTFRKLDGRVGIWKFNAHSQEICYLQYHMNKETYMELSQYTVLFFDTQEMWLSKKDKTKNSMPPGFVEGGMNVKTFFCYFF